MTPESKKLLSQYTCALSNETIYGEGDHASLKRCREYAAKTQAAREALEAHIEKLESVPELASPASTPEASQQAAAKAPIKPLEEERADFEDWFMGRFDEPIQSRECARQWSAWLARSTGEYKARDGWKVSPKPWGIDTFPVAAKAPAAQAVDAPTLPPVICVSRPFPTTDQAMIHFARDVTDAELLAVNEALKSRLNRPAAYPASTPEASKQAVQIVWDYSLMGLPNEEVTEMWRAAGHSGTVPFSFANRIQERLQTVLASQQAAAVAAPSEPVTYVTGSDTVIGRESRGLQWIKGFSPFKLEPGTKLYAAPATAVAVTASEDTRDAARYRYLRSQNTSLEAQQRDKGIVNRPSCYHEVEGICELKWGEELDAAIDAAMRATQQEGGK